MLDKVYLARKHNTNLLRQTKEKIQHNINFEIAENAYLADAT